MTASSSFTPWDFVQLVKELSEHEAELKIKLANAGLGEPRRDGDNDDPA